MLILDAHADIVPLGVSSRYGDADGSSKVTPQKLRAGGVDVVVMAAVLDQAQETPPATRPHERKLMPNYRRWNKLLQAMTRL